MVQDFDYFLDHEDERNLKDQSYEESEFSEIEEDIKTLDKKARIEKMAEWFFSMFKDPQNQTPYAIDKDSPYNYEYIWGGPYYAADEIGGTFADVASDDEIEVAVDIVQDRDGIYEWAPSDNHPDMKRADEELSLGQEEFEFEDLQKIATKIQATNIGSDNELAARSDLARQIKDLKSELPKPSSHGGIGHNHPPEEFELHGKVLTETAESLNAIEVEIESKTPDIAKIAKKASNLKSTIGWAANKLDMTVDAFCKGFGSSLGKATGVSIPTAILLSPYWEKLASLFLSLKAWIFLVLGISL